MTRDDRRPPTTDPSTAVRRRGFLGLLATASVAGTAGCLDSLSGGQFAGGADRTQLTAQRGEIVEIFADAVERRNDGVRTRDEAIETFNDEAYEEATEMFEAAFEHFESAKQGFADAAALAFELGEDDAGSICEAAEEDAELQIAATEAGLNAAEAASGGGSAADVNEHVVEYQELVEQSREVTVEDPQTLVEVLESD